MAYKKSVQSVVPSEDPLSDFVGIIDIIEMQLGIQSGEPTVSERLGSLLAHVRLGEPLGEGHVQVLVDAVERLRKIETYLTDFWTSGQPSERPRA